MKILVCGPSWVGDMVMAQSLFEHVRQGYPESIIDVLAPTWSASLLARMPQVNTMIELPIGHNRLCLGKRRQIWKQLAKAGYDQAIITQRSLKAALIPYFAKIPVRTGYLGEMRFGFINDRRPLDKSKLTQTVQRMVALGCEKDDELPPANIPYPSLTINMSNRKRCLDSLRLTLQRPAIVFCPGAEYGPAKQWPIENFRKLAKVLVDLGYQVWVLGSSKDQTCGHSIASGQESYVHDLTGKTSLEDAIDLMSVAKAAVSNDSGLMHVAAATGIQVEGIYGSSSPYFTPPLTEHKNIHYIGLECSPCFKKKCPFAHTACLRLITVDHLLQSLI